MLNHNSCQREHNWSVWGMRFCIHSHQSCVNLGPATNQTIWQAIWITNACPIRTLDFWPKSTEAVRSTPLFPFLLFGGYFPLVVFDSPSPAVVFTTAQRIWDPSHMCLTSLVLQLVIVFLWLQVWHNRFTIRTGARSSYLSKLIHHFCPTLGLYYWCVAIPTMKDQIGIIMSLVAVKFCFYLQ